MKSENSEKIIEHRLVIEVARQGGWCVKMANVNVMGFPDRLVLLPKAKIAFVELKSTGCKPRKLQLLIQERLRALGFRVEVIDSIPGVIQFVNSMANANN